MSVVIENKVNFHGSPTALSLRALQLKALPLRALSSKACHLAGAAVVCLVLSSCGGGSGDATEEPGAPAAANEQAGMDSTSTTGGGTDNTSTDAGESDATETDVTDTDSSVTDSAETDPAETDPAETETTASETDGGSSSITPITDNSDIEPPLGYAGEIRSVSTPRENDPFSKFQLDDVLYTNNVYDGRQLDADNNWQLVFYGGVQDFVRWEVPALIGNDPNPCVRPQSVDPVMLSYRLTSRKDSPTERNTFVRSYPAMVVGSMGGRFESWGVECGVTNSILPDIQRHGGSPVFQMDTVAEATGLPVRAAELDYDIRVSVKADITAGDAANGVANVFMDSYWHNVSDVSLVPGGDSSLVNTINGISSDITEVWNLNIWFDYPRFEGRASSWTGGFKIGSVLLEEGGAFDVYFKIEGSRDGHRPRCVLGTAENCFLYIGLVAVDPNAARNGITVNYTEIADWMQSSTFRDLFLTGAFETDTPAAKAHEAWRMIDGTGNDNNPDPAKRGPRFPDAEHVIGGIHLGSELWYNPDAEPATIVFDSLGVEVEGKGHFGRYSTY